MRKHGSFIFAFETMTIMKGGDNVDNNKICYDVVSGEFFMANEKEFMEKLNKHFVEITQVDSHIIYMIYDRKYFVSTLAKNVKARIAYEKALDYVSK